MDNAMKMLKENSVFWSKMGWCYDPPRLGADGKPIAFFENFERFAKFHKDFANAGIKIHTSILFSGWVGVNQYDYELTDLTLDAILKDNPDIYYIPRIKLNVPLDWGRENPEDVFVYFDGPREVEEIRRLVGTEKHDFLGYDSKIGYYTAGSWKDDRPNVGGLISNQSFSSKKWLKDAGETLKRLIHRLEQGPYSKQILAYHIAYGASGETCLWGRCSNKFGDYGVANSRAFFDWGIKQYGSLDVLRNTWNLPELDRDNAEPPPPEHRQPHPVNVRGFLRSDDCICADYDRFTSEINVNAIEHFGKLVKENTDSKPVGCFYGYFLECHNAAYSGWLGYERILNSPYIDFLAAPKSYYRSQVGEPGGTLGPTQSVNRKKLWMDELDNRTHIVTGVGFEHQSANMNETRTVMWREFAKNMAHGSGFWWMDLGGGWFDSPEILQEVAIIERTAACLRQKSGKSVAEILLVVDEESAGRVVSNFQFHKAIMMDMIRNANLCGAPTDTYRLNDLETLDLAQYKLIIFLNTFKLLPDQWRCIAARIPQHATLLWNYAPGALNPEFSIDNIEKIIGMKVRERNMEPHPQLLPEYGSILAETSPMGSDADVDYPLLEIVPSGEIQVMARYEDGAIAVASMQCDGRNIIFSVLPFFGTEHLRRIAEVADCHLYVPMNCTVYADSRFIGIFPKVDFRDAKLEFKNKVTLESAVTGRLEISTQSVTLNLKAKEMEFFVNEGRV